jgi:hypothetical protein
VFGSLILKTGSDLPVSIALPPDEGCHGPLRSNYASLTALFTMAEFAGFTDLEVVDEHFGNALADPNVATEARRRRLAERLGVDAEVMFGFVIIKGRFAPTHRGVPGSPVGALEDAWLRRRSLWFADPTNERSDAPLVRHAQNLQAKVDGHQHAMSFLRGALADREADLQRERAELVVRRSQVEASRIAARRWREEVGHLLDKIEK